MKRLNLLPYIVPGMLLIMHGIAHTPAVLGSWGLATFEDVSRAPNVWLTGAGDVLVAVFGLFWLVAAASFIVAGVGLMRQMIWWPLVAAFALIVSTPLTILWQEDAVVGLLLNGFILAGLLLWMLVISLHEHQTA